VAFDVHLARDDPRHVEEIADELGQERGVPFDDVERMGPLRLLHRTPAQDPRPAHDRGQGCSQLV